MDSCDPPVRLTPVQDSGTSAAGSQQGPVVSYSQDYDIKPHWDISTANFIQKEGQANVLPSSQQQWHEQYFSMNGQNGPLAQNQNEVYTPFQQQSLNHQMTSTSNQAIFYPQNTGAQAPFIYQQRHTTLHPAPQQQQQNQERQHQTGQNERLSPHRYTQHRNDVFMPSHRPKFDQFLTSPSKLDRRWDSLDCKIHHLQPLFQFDGAMENMSTSAAIPIGNLTTSFAVPMENPSAFPLNPIGNMSTSPAVPIGIMSAIPAVPMGNLLASPTKNISVYHVEHMGNMSTFPCGSMVNQSVSPTESIGNDHSILHDLNQSPYLDPIDDSFSQFPIIAEKRSYDDSSEESENSILAKRPKRDVDTDPLCTSVNNQDLSGDESGSLDSGNNKDPLSDLTKEQRVVLYTLFLYMVDWSEITMDEEVSMGDIDVWKIVKELENKGLVMLCIDHKKSGSHMTKYL